VLGAAASVRLELDSRPESVTLVRGTLAGLADYLHLGSELLNDLKTAVSEACNNVVVHAYGDGQGPMRVSIQVSADGLSVDVRDRGCGMDAGVAREDSMGVGMAVIGALTARAEFLSPVDGGTEVRMWFSGAPTGSPDRWDDHLLRGGAAAGSAPVALSGDVVVTVSPVALVTPVLGRLARAMAAGARFSFDRFADVYLVADTLGAHAEETASDERVSFALQSLSKRLDLRLGPLRAGSGRRLRQAHTDTPGECPLARLADEIRFSEAGRAELLHVVVRDHGTPVRSGG
jgi:anti-sigma regulatory factor (Ser/Thr protein kinase)